MNTPNWMNGLPGHPYAGDDPDGFMTHTELVESFHDYVETSRLDVRTGVNVTRVTESGRPHDRFNVETDSADGPSVMSCSHLVVASGIAQSPRIPPAGAKLPGHILQLSTGSYKSPGSLPDGAVLVVGVAQSGGQIVEDLLDAGRTVYFSISRVGRLPRRYRGRDFMYWMRELGIWDIPTSEAEPDQIKAPNPLTSGVGPRGHTISHQQLAAKGAGLLGHLLDVVDMEVITDRSDSPTNSPTDSKKKSTATSSSLRSKPKKPASILPTSRYPIRAHPTSPAGSTSAPPMSKLSSGAPDSPATSPGSIFPSPTSSAGRDTLEV